MFNLKVESGNFITSQKPSFWIGISPIIISFILSMVILFGMRSLPPQLPLFYSLSWGDNQLATHREFLLIPAIIIVITVFNSVISWQLHPSQSFFKKILLFSPLVISLLFTITFIKIILNFI